MKVRCQLQRSLARWRSGRRNPQYIVLTKTQRGQRFSAHSGDVSGSIDVEHDPAWLRRAFIPLQNDALTGGQHYARAPIEVQLVVAPPLGDAMPGLEILGRGAQQCRRSLAGAVPGNASIQRESLHGARHDNLIAG